MIAKLEELVQKVKQNKPKRLAVACGEDPHTIQAVGKAVKEGIVKAVLTGDQEKIKKVAQENKIDPASFEIVHVPEKTKAVYAAIERVSSGDCNFLMKGLIDSSVYMRAILEEGKKKNASKEGPIVSHVSVIELPTYSKLLVVSDIAVIPYPDLKMKLAMLNYSIAVAHSLGIEKPKASLVCAVEKVNIKMPPTVDAAIIAKMSDRGQIKGAIVDGPLSLDASVSMESKKIKSIESEVAGDADILIFPNIDVGNVFFKTCTQLAKAEVAAIVTGAFCPCILTSRADSEKSKYYSIALGSLMA